MSAEMSVLVSRRQALAWAFSGAAALGCRSGTASAPPEAEPAWGGLEVAQVTQMADSERGGVTVVLLHGFGASGDDLVSLAQALQVPRSRFVLPAAPIRLLSGGRAWWNIDALDRPRYVTDPDASAANAPAAASAALDAARGAVQGVLRTAVQRYRPESLLIAGFSQGAMLSLDVALAASPPVKRVGVLSGALLVDAALRLSAAPSPRPEVFISHGRKDNRLSFEGGERMKTELEAHGFSVTFRPFDGGHQIPNEVVSELRRFLFAV